MYRIIMDAPRNLIQVELGGLLSAGEVTSYITDLRAAIMRERIRPGYRLIVDVSSCTIQTQDVVQTVGKHMATMPKAGAIAVVTASSLARMQVRRLFTQPYARVTTTVAEGRAWVLHGTEPAADPPHAAAG